MAGFTFQKASKAQRKGRIALIGPSGSGKTYTALTIATGLGERIALIDTENRSASLYADRFDFDTLQLDTFAPETYVAAIRAAEDAGYEVVIIDSLSHAWMGKDGALEQVDKAAARSRSGNSFAAWREVTPKHNELVDAMIRCKCHLIVTMRAKTEYVIEQVQRNGKTVNEPRKIGLAPVQRDGLEYEFDIVADMDWENRFIVSKTRFDKLTGEVMTKPGRELGETIRAWLSDGAPEPEPRATPAPTPNQPPRQTSPNRNGSTNGQAKLAAPSASTGDLADRLKAAVESSSQKDVATRAGVSLSSVAKLMSGLDIDAEDRQKIEAFLSGGAPAPTNGNRATTTSDSTRKAYFAVATSALSVDSETAKAYAKWKAADWLGKDIESFNDIPGDTVSRLIDYVSDTAPDKLTGEVRTMRHDMGIPDDVPTGEDAPIEQGALV